MKWAKAVGLLVAFASMGIAGWQLSKYFGADSRTTSVPRPPAQVVPDLEPLPPLVKPKILVLSDILKPPAPEMTDAEWRAAYPAIVAALEKPTAITPVSIPWRFGATNAKFNNDSPMAQAMAFLIASDLAWCPAAYQVPPAFAVFRVNGDRESDVNAMYEPQAISERVKQWNGTHAIGGVLVRSDEGFVATLQVFDTSGKLVREVAVEKPQSFFALLGDVSSQALTHFGSVPSDGLLQQLRRQRCKPESLTALGRTAFVPANSTADFPVYDAILRDDSGFAEARQWRAVWQTQRSGGAADIRIELHRAMTDAVHVGALADLCQMEPPETVAGRDISGWLDAVEALAGKDHPDVLAMRLKHIEGARRSPWANAISLRQLYPFARGAARYPHHVRLCNALLRGQDVQDGNAALCASDAELAASLALARIYDNRRPALDKANHWRQVAEAALLLGRHGHVLEACRRMQGHPDSVLVDVHRRFLEASARMQFGEFDKAADLFSSVVKRSSSTQLRDRAAHRGATCAVLAGRKRMLEDQAIDPAANSGSSASFFAMGLGFLAGEPVDRALMRMENELAGDILFAECELAQGGDFGRSDRGRVWLQWTQRSDFSAGDRLRWILFERFYRVQPNLQHAAGFYEAAEWEYPDDPAVKAAVDAWRKRGGDTSLPTAEKLAGQLRVRQWQANTRPPTWQAVARVRRDLSEGRLDDAILVVNALSDRYGSNTSRLAWLMRRVNAAAGTTQPPMPVQ